MAKSLTDLIGRRFGMVVVLGMAPDRRASSGRLYKRLRCECDCGKFFDSNVHNVLGGVTQSCGCRRGITNTKHGMRHTPEYAAWRAMKARCNGGNPITEKYYASHGVHVCPEWANSFEAFFRDMGPRPGPGYSLDRIDGRKGYSAGNCRWATKQQQIENRSNTVWIDYMGERVTLMVLSRRSGVGYLTIRHRINAGWPEDRWLIPPTSRGGRPRQRK